MSLTITVDQRTLQAVIRRLSPDQFRRRGLVAIHESLAYLQGEVREETPLDTGLLRGSVATDVRGVAANLRGRVFSPLEYAQVVEFGRRPGRTMPPVAVIQGWAGRKLGDGSRATAWLIARAIGRRGIPGRHMFRQAAERGRGVVVRIFLRHFRGL